MSDVIGRIEKTISNCDHIRDEHLVSLLADAADEIERLREELAGWENMRESYYHLEKLLAERDKRIEELENHIMEWRMNDGEWFTTEQIRAAWKRRIYEQVSDPSQGIYLKADLLGIVRCEGCGGDGHSMSTFAAKHEQVRTGTCPDCNGGGWVIKCSNEA